MTIHNSRVNQFLHQSFKLWGRQSIFDSYCAKIFANALQKSISLQSDARNVFIYANQNRKLTHTFQLTWIRYLKLIFLVFLSVVFVCNIFLQSETTTECAEKQITASNVKGIVVFSVGLKKMGGQKMTNIV